MLELQMALALGALSVGTPQAGPFDPPDPQVFARPEDQERARLLLAPCTDADIGRGCSSSQGRAKRDYPCTYHIDASTIGSLPIDQCYKMEASRRYRGVWVDEFEGQRFIPEGSNPTERPDYDTKSIKSIEQSERARLARIWFDTSRVTLTVKPRREGKKRFVEFDGRKTMYPGAYGHFGMFGQEVIVDRVISVRDCPETGMCR